MAVWWVALLPLRGCSVCVCVGSLWVQTHAQVRQLMIQSWHKVGVNDCLFLCVSLVIDWQPVAGIVL